MNILAFWNHVALVALVAVIFSAQKEWVDFCSLDADILYLLSWLSSAIY